MNNKITVYREFVAATQRVDTRNSLLDASVLAQEESIRNPGASFLVFDGVRIVYIFKDGEPNFPKMEA